MCSVLLFGVGYILITYSAEIQCSEERSCIGQSLNDTAVVRTAIYGYKSAYGRTTSFSGFGLHCGGSYSCHSMAYMKAETLTPQDLLCTGSHSCANTTVSGFYFIGCHASNACAFTNISHSNTGLTIECHGYKACTYANIYGTPQTDTITAQGTLSLYNAIIDTTNSSIQSNIEVILTGRLAAYGATLMCRLGHICAIQCNGSDSCYMFFVNCEGTCYITHSSFDVYTITNFSQFATSTIDVNSLKLFATEFMEPDTDKLCTVNEWRMDDYPAHSLLITIANITQNLVSLCCRSRYASWSEIYYETEIKTNTICSGKDACYDSNISAIEYGANDNSVYCEGQGSCKRLSLTNIDSVYCFGGGSCKQATISGAQYIVCGGSGGTACSNVVVNSSGSDINVYLTGYQTGTNLTVFCSGNDVCSLFCMGYNSCHGIIWNCDDSSQCIRHNTTYYPIIQPSTTINESNLTIYSTLEPIYSTIYAYITTRVAKDNDDDTNDSSDFLRLIISGSSVIVLCIVVIIVICICSYCKGKETKHSDDDNVKDDSQNEDPHHIEKKDEENSSDDDRYEDMYVNHATAGNDVATEAVEDNEIIADDNATATKDGDMTHITVTEEGDNKHVERRTHSDAFEVQCWLRSVVGLPQYYKDFMFYGYDSMDVMKAIIDANELMEIGVTSTEHQSKILLAIQNLRPQFITGSLEGGQMMITVEGE